MLKMNAIIVFFVLFLFIGFAYAADGNPDILKKKLIADCEEINELGDCVTQKEIEPVTKQASQTFSRVGLSIANSLGVPDFGNALIFLMAFMVLGLLGFGVVIGVFNQ